MGEFVSWPKIFAWHVTRYLKPIDVAKTLSSVSREWKSEFAHHAEEMRKKFDSLPRKVCVRKYRNEIHMGHSPSVAGMGRGRLYGTYIVNGNIVLALLLSVIMLTVALVELLDRYTHTTEHNVYWLCPGTQHRCSMWYKGKLLVVGADYRSLDEFYDLCEELGMVEEFRGENITIK